MDKKTFIFTGRSGAGKGTQASLLLKYFEENNISPIFTFESGKKVRDFGLRDSYSGKLSKEVDSRGELQPSFIPIWAWAGELIEELDGEHHMIIDGTPRKLSEAIVLSEALEFYKKKNIKVIYLDISEKESSRRLKDRGRKDDTDEGIKNKAKWFENNIIPVIEYLDKHDNFEVIKIDGEKPVEEVHAEILKSLVPHSMWKE